MEYNAEKAKMNEEAREWTSFPERPALKWEKKKKKKKKKQKHQLVPTTFWQFKFAQM